MIEINGFKVDKFNQYNLPEKVKVSTCPLCSEARKKKTDKCLQIFWDTGLAKCHHCGEVIQLHTYAKKEERKVYSKPTWQNKTKLSDNLVKWFEARGISQFSLRIMKITEGKEWMPQTQKEENTIQFNYFRNGELINIKYRDGRKNFKLFKDAEKIFYNLDLCATSKEIIIVEGEMDALSFIEAGLYNVVSIPNGSTIGNVNLDYLDNSIEYFANKDKIYLALDNDEPGQNVTKELVRRLGSEKCFLVHLNGCKDANELLTKESKESLVKAIADAKEIPIDGVSSVMDWREDFEDYLINGMNQGYLTGIESFDQIFSTYTSQYIVVTGIPSSGKSDFVDQMVIGYNKLYEWKTAFASPENKPNKIHAGKLISKICGKWIHSRLDLQTGWFQRAIEIIDYNYKFIDLDDGFDLESVLEKTKSLIFKYGIKVLVIDPYNKVRLKSSLNKNINEYTNDYLLMIDDFARKYDILIILVAHPRKPTMNEGKAYEPNFYDIKGGGEFYDMSPHGILVHRDYANDMVKIKVLKVKFSHLGKNNKHVWTKWNTSNGRYVDFEEQNELAEQTCGGLYDDSNWVAIGDEVEPEKVKHEEIKVIDNSAGFTETNESPF